MSTDKIELGTIHITYTLIVDMLTGNSLSRC